MFSAKNCYYVSTHAATEPEALVCTNFSTTLCKAQYFALDGVACVGKTSILKKFKESGLQVSLGDFAQYQEEDPRFIEKKNNIFIDLVYQSFLFCKVVDGAIHNHCPITNALYCLILRYSDNYKYETKCEITDELNWFCEKLLQTNFRNKWNVLIVLSKDPAKTLDKMKQRKHNLDVLDINYVHAQNFVFKYFAAKMKFPTVKVEVLEVEDVLPTIIPFVNKSSHINAPINSKGYDAGIDLSTDNNYEILPHCKKIISFIEKLNIEPGYVGLLTLRSSLSNKLIANTGIIDSGFFEKIQCSVFNASNELISLYKYQRVAQIVIVPFSNKIVSTQNLSSGFIRYNQFSGSSGE
ncbi:hypothetical protein ABEB36_000007 [Hypothenemus hampei]|uniref:Deoxyuridine 5'-triphosphate nucleotidohydrolase n=1 Tax=Hypothenemus hampei TaxID=57062 RepID=A0ABD1FBT6_HYPHA